MSDGDKVRNVRLKLALVALVFFGPLALAWVLYYTLPDPGADARTNAGVLLEPARPLPELSLGKDGVFREQWTLVTVAPDGCGETCRARLADTRQVRALLHRRSTRVQRVLISGAAADAGLTDDAHPDLRVFEGQGRLADFFARVGEEAVGPGVIYLIDPLGNWVLYYPSDAKPDAIFKDIKHLLKLSQVG